MTRAAVPVIGVLDDIAVERAKTGDLDALERVYRSYEGLVYSMARRICRSEEDAEDVLQETFLEVCRSIRRHAAATRCAGPSATGWDSASLYRQTVSTRRARYCRSTARAKRCSPSPSALLTGAATPW